ncbi:MAG: metallophosphoesterase [Candidatus Bathyarchaeota archaeon]|nr:metallophosphoesterase [Candidatus Bathyarchaeota archaeon]
MKLCFLSDAHLFQTYMEKYDPLSDFAQVLNSAAKLKPDAIILAGDMFDYKKTATTYLRHYEGEASMIRIRKLLTTIDVPIFAVRGNHEKSEVLMSLDQTVENFHYRENEWEKIGELDVYFLETCYETSGYDTKRLKTVFETVVKEASNYSAPVLVMHETLAPFDNAVPPQIIEKCGPAFNHVFNGHMHYYDAETYRKEKTVILPSLLPSRVVWGKYWMERYRWGPEDSKYIKEERPSPFGFVIFDSEKRKLKFHRFNPSRKILLLHFEFSNTKLEEARRRLRSVLDELNARKGKEELIVLPAVSGQLEFSPVFLEDIPHEYPDLFVTEILKEFTRKTPFLVGEETLAPIVSPEQIWKEVRKLDSEILQLINEKLPSKISLETVRGVIDAVLKEDSNMFQGPTPKITVMLRNFVERVTKIIQKKEGMKKPKNFETHLEEFVKKVKE